MTSSVFKGGLRISLFPLSSSDIFSFVGFLVCFLLKTVGFETEWSSDEAVDGLSGDDGVKVDWRFKDVVSVEVGWKDVGGVTLPILRVGRPYAVNREFRTVSKVPGSSQFLSVAISQGLLHLQAWVYLGFYKLAADFYEWFIHEMCILDTEILKKCFNYWRK